MDPYDTPEPDWLSERPSRDSLTPAEARAEARWYGPATTSSREEQRLAEQAEFDRGYRAASTIRDHVRNPLTAPPLDPVQAERMIEWASEGTGVE